MNLIEAITTAIKDGVRSFKTNAFGRYDPRTATEVAPWGTDACPLDGVKVVYSKTARDGDEVVLGVVNTKQEALPGEHRIYSTKANGDVANYIWLHNSTGGALELNGTGDNVVRYTQLDAGLQSTAGVINANLTAIATALNALVPGSYTPVVVNVNISAAKVDNLKCSS